MGSNNRGAAIPSTQRDERTLLQKTVVYLPPWLLAGALWLVAALAHAMWGGNAAALPWVACGLTLATAGLTVLTAKVTSTNKPSQQAHSTGTVAAALAWLTVATIAGPAIHPLIDVWLIGGPSGALSWNIRRLLKGSDKDGESKGGDGELFKAVKLAGAKVRGELDVKPNKVTAPLQLPSGQLSAEDVTKAKNNLASGLSVPQNGVRVTPDPDHFDRATLTVVPRDVLGSPTPWAGASSPAGSVMDPLVVGVYEDGDPVCLWLPGDKNTARNATHVLVMGMNGSGKSHGAKLVWAELLSRSDVVLWAADPSKGKQTFGPVLDGLDWAAMSLDSAQQMVDCLPDVIHARANYLGEQGYDQWVPGCGLPYLVVWIEEASRVVRDSDTMIDIAQEARSAGVSLVLSMQRASYDNMPTAVRSQLGAAWCFGVKDLRDAGFALSDEVMEAGANPGAWKNQKPGYAYLEAPGVDMERHPTPLRTYSMADEQLAAVVAEHAPYRAQLDTITARAAGQAYAAARAHTESEEDKDTVTNQPEPAPSAPSNVRKLDPFKGRISEKDDRNPPELPDDPEPDLDGDADTELPEVPEELNIEFPARRPSLTEARRLLHDVLIELHARGATEVGPKDIPDEFPRSRSWISPEMSRLAIAGDVLVETDRDGVYRFTPGMSNAA